MYCQETKQNITGIYYATPKAISSPKYFTSTTSDTELEQLPGEEFSLFPLFMEALKDLGQGKSLGGYNLGSPDSFNKGIYLLEGTELYTELHRLLSASTCWRHHSYKLSCEGYSRSINVVPLSGKMS